MASLIECIPNFSEGQNEPTIKAIAQAITAEKGAFLLHQDTGYAANRTVFTYAGTTKAIFEATFRALKVATEKIDMRFHRGEHPRIGVCDVCPFVPISGISSEELIPLVHDFAQKVNRELDIPVYLYEQSASSEERRNLARHRVGNYEALQKRIESRSWLPDFGTYNPKSGGTVMGVRNFLVAYNINLSTMDPAIAREIAYDLRELGRPIAREKGRTIYKAGILKKVKAIGWYIEDFKKVQVSINLTDYQQTPLHKVYETTQELAAKYGTEISGSELIGLIPLEAILQSGRYFSKKETANEEELIQTAVKHLGLDDIKPFEYNKRILEYVLQTKAVHEKK
jgi:glutamate formiminotransferase/formiminotetrahydrofolate cyclodeaminase